MVQRDFYGGSDVQSIFRQSVSTLCQPEYRMGMASEESRGDPKYNKYKVS